MGQKKNDTDAAAEFFGEGDVDWLNDDEDGGATERLPVAPPPVQPPARVAPPPPPPTLTRTASPLDGSTGTAPAQESHKEDGWAAKISEAPADRGALASAPTLIFSSVPTVPPAPSPIAQKPAVLTNTKPAPEPKPPVIQPSPAVPASGPLPLHTSIAATAHSDEGTTQEIPRQTSVTLEPVSVKELGLPQGQVIVEPTREEPIPTPAQRPPPAQHAAQVVAAAPSPGPVVRASTPTGVPRTIAPPAPQHPQQTPTSAIERDRSPQNATLYIPREGQDAWIDTISILEDESKYTTATGRLSLYSAAGRIALRRLVDLPLAERLLTSGDRSIDSLRNLCEVYERLSESSPSDHNYTEQEHSFLDIAKRSTGMDRSNAFASAARIAAEHRNRPAEAVTYLRESVANSTDDYASRVMLLEHIEQLQRERGAQGDPSRGVFDDRIVLCSDLAQLSEGGIAADARIKQADLAAEARLPDQVLRALDLALQAEPGHTGAFQRLERALGDDPLGLAKLYEREASRPGQPDRGWWKCKAARAWLAAGQTDDAVSAFNAAIAEGYTFTQRELQGAYYRNSSFRDLESILVAEAETLSLAEGRAFALFRLGWLRELHLADIEGAITAYRDAVSVDAAASPAADAVVRLLSDAERILFVEERIERDIDPDERSALKLWLAEQAELRNELPQARRLFEELSKGQGAEAEIALDGLDRVLQRMNDADALSLMRRTRAESSADSNDRIAWLLLAASVPANLTTAVPMWLSALDSRPDHPVALAAVSVALETEQRWSELATRLRAAGEAAPDTTRKAAYLYRAACVLSEHGRDKAAAIACIERALKVEPRLRPARWLARSLQSVRDATVEAALYRDQALHATDSNGRTWARYAAAVLRGFGPDARSDLEAILVDRPDHIGAISMLEVLLVAERDKHSLIGSYRRAIGPTAQGVPTDGKNAVNIARLAARTAELLLEIERRDEAILVLRRLRGVEGAPVGPAALLALAAGAPERAIDLLSDSKLDAHRRERARLLYESGRGADALPLLIELAANSEDRIGSAARAIAIASKISDTSVVIAAHATIAQHAKSQALRTAHATWAALRLAAAGRHVEAIEHWMAVLRMQPSTDALLGASSSLVSLRNPEKIWRLFAEFRPNAGPLLADALLAAGDKVGAADVLASHAATLSADPQAIEQRLATLLELELSRAELGDWQRAYDALVQRRELCRSEIGRARIDARRRWMLSEKLASTDAAWDLHLRLHEDAPNDRTVTAALARIAAARGDIVRAIGWLKQLAETAPTREDAARHRCQMGEVYEIAGQSDLARQSYLDALDDVPGDQGALDGLRSIAERAEDWPSLVAVLAREVSGARRPRQIELLSQIASITEERMGDKRVALDRWRAVIDLDNTSRDALEHMLSLAEELGEWGVFVEAAEQLSTLLTGRERAALLRKIGITCQDKLGRDDAARWYEAAVADSPPDHEAALRLEAIARARADWPAAVRALKLAASAYVEPSVRVQALLSAAHIESDALHDKEAAASCYRSILEIDPKHEVSLRFMAAHLFDAKRFDEALPIASRLEPLIRQGQDLDDFDTTMELSNFYYAYAEMLKARGDDEQALPRYESALSLNPNHLPALEAIGPLYFTSSEWKKAEAVYRQLLQFSGGQGDRAKLASTYTSLGLIERELGSPDKASKRFAKALELHPNHVGALKGMALVLEDRGDWSNLLNIYNTIIYHATVPEDVIDAYMTKGRVLDDQMQRQDKASQHYQRSLDFDPNQPNAYLRLAELAMRRDAYKEAGELSDKALQLDADLVQKLRPLLLLVRAASWQDAGRQPEADRCLREARMLDTSLMVVLGDNALQDLERLRQTVKDRLAK